MSILKIARLGHPILYKKTSPVDNISDPNITKLIHDMTETMLDAKGIGLAAPQVYASKQVIIFRSLENQTKENNHIKITALINPKINKISDDTENQWEESGNTSSLGKYSKKLISKKFSELFLSINTHLSIDVELVETMEVTL